jgi:hypothetical protein
VPFFQLNRGIDFFFNHSSSIFNRPISSNNSAFSSSGLLPFRFPLSNTSWAEDKNCCFHASLAEFERDIIRERTQAGLTAARARGRCGGRPPGLSSHAESIACAAETLYLERKLSVREIAQKLYISKSTLYAYLRYRKISIGKYASKVGIVL